jgi:hypothetical protein
VREGVIEEHDGECRHATMAVTQATSRLYPNAMVRTGPQRGNTGAGRRTTAMWNQCPHTGSRGVRHRGSPQAPGASRSPPSPCSPHRARPCPGRELDQARSGLQVSLGCDGRVQAAPHACHGADLEEHWAGDLEEGPTEEVGSYLASTSTTDGEEGRRGPTEGGGRSGVVLPQLHPIGVEDE